jgi:hypothetical protein
MPGEFFVSFENQTLVDCSVSLDNGKYVNCRFERVNFLYSGGPWSIEKCIVGPGCALLLQGAAERTASLLSSAPKLLGPIQVSMGGSGPVH